MEKNISGYTKTLGIIGNPVKHSLSPKMYNRAFRELGLDCVYLAFEAEPGDGGKAVEAYKKLGFVGGNVTMPFKNEVVPFMDQLSVEAEILGAVNTIVIIDGKVKGYNTDGKGLVSAIKAEGVTVKGKKVTMFGAGGAGVSILVATALEGATEINLIVLEVPDQKLKAIVDHIGTAASDCTVTFTMTDDQVGREEKVKRGDIIINATPLGMSPHTDTTPLENYEILGPHQTVVDVVYNPVQTRFLRESKSLGCRTIDGRGMLLWQGAEAFKLFTGQEMPIEAVRQELFEG